MRCELGIKGNKHDKQALNHAKPVFYGELHDARMTFVLVLLKSFLMEEQKVIIERDDMHQAFSR